MSTRTLGPARASVVLICAHVFQPIDRCSVELFLDRDVGHCRGRRRSVPVLLTGPKPHDIPRPDVLDGAAPTLRSSGPGCDDQGLPERVGVPCRARAWFKRDARASSPRRLRRIEQRIDANCSCKPLCRTLVDGCEPLLLISMSPLKVVAEARPNGSVMAATAIRRTSRLVHSAFRPVSLRPIVHTSAAALVGAFAAGQSSVR